MVYEPSLLSLGKKDLGGSLQPAEGIQCYIPVQEM